LITCPAFITTLRKDKMGSQSERQAEYFQFLNELRESGITNMFGAARYLEDKFPELSRQEATTELSAWMKSFDKKDAEEEMPTVAAAWKRHWDDRDSAELAKAEADAHTEYLEKMGDAHDEVRTDREKEETN